MKYKMYNVERLKRVDFYVAKLCIQYTFIDR